MEQEAGHSPNAQHHSDFKKGTHLILGNFSLFGKHRWNEDEPDAARRLAHALHAAADAAEES